MFGNVSFLGLNNTFFAADTVKTDSQSLKSLKNEEKTEVQTLNLNLTEQGVQVLFEDSKSKQLVSLNLSEDNYFRLKNKFREENNFYLRNDGQVRLNGEAQNFVSGWFSHFAHTLNWLGADKNQNAKVEQGELDNAFMSLALAKIKPNEVSFSSETKIASQLVNSNTELSIEGGLNAALRTDSNLDGKITHAENFSPEKLRELAKKAQELAIEKGETKNKKISKEEDVLEKAKKQGIASLNVSELSELEQKYPMEYEKLKKEDSEDSSNLKQALAQDFQKQFFNADFKMLDLKI